MTTFLVLVLLALIIVFGVDVRQKRRAQVQRPHQSWHSSTFDEKR